VIRVNECGSLDAIPPLPVDREGRLVFFDVEWFVVPIVGQPCGKLIGRVKQPRISGFGGEQDNLTDRNDAQIVFGSPAQNVANFVGKTKILAIHHALIPSTLDRFLQYIRYLDVNGERRELCAAIDPDLDCTAARF
jgi:hypothetical protein